MNLFARTILHCYRTDTPYAHKGQLIQLDFMSAWILLGEVAGIRRGRTDLLLKSIRRLAGNGYSDVVEYGTNNLLDGKPPSDIISSKVAGSSS
jgi:hypothetical protein